MVPRNLDEGFMKEGDRLLFSESALERETQIKRTTRLHAAAADYVRVNDDDDGGALAPMPLDDDWVLRNLCEPEVETLRGPCRCRCQDWSKIRLLLRREECDKDQSYALELLVSDNAFAGLVVLGVDGASSPEDTSEWHRLPAGIHSNALVADCILEPHCRVYRNTMLMNTHVGALSVVANCGHISFTESFTWNKLDISVGPESGGGRNVQTTAETTMKDVCSELGMSTGPRSGTWSPTSPRTVECQYNIIGRSSLVRDTPTLANIYLAPKSSIVAATSVANTLLLSQASIGNASTVSNSFLQWDACVTDRSSVSDCLLMEQAHVGPHSLVTSSILGPDVHVSAGEIHASVLGPNTNAHHQSLVISVLWPLGRGNVGYGANVGSNHTGRLPDQETVAAEGTFWGLTTCIKFPVDMSLSPYTIVAAGTTLPPQRIAMPFSLIVETDGVNHILPGWVLHNSPYTLSRSEAKFVNRRKAMRHKDYTGWSIVRPSTVDMCIAARQSLQSNATQDGVYKTDGDVIGIGKNHLTERARTTGIQAYTQCIQRYALRGLLMWIDGQHSSIVDTMSTLSVEIANLKAVSLPTADSLMQVRWPTLPWEEDAGSRWYHCLSLLQAEFPLQGDVMSWVIDVLGILVSLEQEYATQVYKSKKRDDTRGAKTIPNYASAHVAAEDDSIVVAAAELASQTEAAVKRLVGNRSKL